MVISTQQLRESLRLAPESSGGGGGSGPAGNPAAQQGGAGEATPPSDTDPFAGIDLDDLEPATRKVIEASRIQFAASQKRATEAEAARVKSENEARLFQQRHDQLKHQVDKLTGAGAATQDPVEVAKAERISKLTHILVSRGVPEQQAKGQAEVMFEMMGEFGTALKNEIGRDFAPLTTSVVMRDAESAWSQALASDKVGALLIPEVHQATLAQVQIMVDQGKQVTADIVKNLSGMFYLKHLETGASASTTTVTTPQLPNIGRPSFGGGQPLRPPIIDPTAPRHQLDAATDAALQSVYSKWDVKPKAYRGNK